MRRWIMVAALVPVLGVLLAAALHRGDGVDLPAPITLDEAKALPDDQLIHRLLQDTGARLIRSRGGESAWRHLRSPVREFWLGSAYESHVVRGDLMTYLVARKDASPGLADIRDGYRDLGAVGIGQALDEAVAVETGDGRQAVDECRQFKAENHCPPSVRPPGFANPFTAVQQRLQAAAAAQRIDEVRAAFVRSHLAGLIAPSE